MVTNGYDLDLVLQYRGGTTNQHHIDLYDLSESLRGLHRTLALTTHYLLNDEIITHAPALKEAYIYAYPAEPGSFIQKVKLVASSVAITALLTQPNNTFVGHLMYSAYDFVVKTTLGIHVDINEPLYKTYLKNEKLQREIKRSKLESIADRCDNSLKEMHRPIYRSKASISLNIQPPALEGVRPIHLSGDTYDSLRKVKLTTDAEMFTGRVSLYSANTRKGRIYVEEEQRTIPFHIAKKTYVHVPTLSESLDIYTKLHDSGRAENKAGYFKFMAKRGYSANNTTRFYQIHFIYKDSLTLLSDIRTEQE